MKPLRLCPGFQFVLVMVTLSLPAMAQKKPEAKPKSAQSIPELRQQLEKILHDTHTPGMSIAIVHRDGPEWTAGLGKADVATSQPATDDTLSVSAPPPRPSHRSPFSSW